VCCIGATNLGLCYVFALYCAKALAEHDRQHPGGGDLPAFNCTACAIGFRGSEDLGGGLKAIFSLDFQHDATWRNDRKVTQSKQDGFIFTPNGIITAPAVTNVQDSVDSITDRDQRLDLAGNLGQVCVGTIATVCKLHGAMLVLLQDCTAGSCYENCLL
jgi:hypothetical protein